MQVAEMPVAEMPVESLPLPPERRRTGARPLYWALVGLVILSPLPFASFHVWAWSAMATGVGLILVVWGMQLALSRRTPAVGVDLVWPILALFGAVVLWILIQLSPYSPAAWHHPLWGTSAILLGGDVASGISINPYATASTLVRLLTYAGIFWLALQYCRSAKRARLTLFLVALSGLAYAAYGLVVEFTGAKTILWENKVHYLDSLTSTFGYKNAYATFAGLGLVCAVGLLLDMMDQVARRGYGHREALRLALVNIIERGWILVVAAIALLTALLLSDSRGGFLSTIAALVVLSVSVALTSGGAKRLPRMATAAVLIAAAAFISVSGSSIVDRLAPTTLDYDLRPRLFELTVSAIEDDPWIGTGYGTFSEVFRFYQTGDLPAPARRAHNTYLDNALELGIPAASALTLAVAGIGVICFAGLRRRRREVVFPCIGLSATVLIGLHALVDFTTQVPAVMATYCLIAGAACGQSWSSTRRPDLQG